MQIRDLEEQLAALQKAVGASQQAKDAVAAAGNASLLIPHSKSDRYDYDAGRQQHEEMDEDTHFHPKVESPLALSASPEPLPATNGQALAEELFVTLLYIPGCRTQHVLMTLFFLLGDNNHRDWRERLP